MVPSWVCGELRRPPVQGGQSNLDRSRIEDVVPIRESHSLRHSVEVEYAEAFPNTEPTLVRRRREGSKYLDENRSFGQRKLAPVKFIDVVVEVIVHRRRTDRMTNHVNLHSGMGDFSVLGCNLGPSPGSSARLRLSHGMKYPAVSIKTFRDGGTRVHCEAVQASCDPIRWTNVAEPGDSFVCWHSVSLPYANIPSNRRSGYPPPQPWTKQVDAMAHSHSSSTPSRSFAIDLMAVVVLVLGLSLLIWSNFVAGWALVGIAVIRLAVSLVNRRRIVNRPGSDGDSVVWVSHATLG